MSLHTERQEGMFVRRCVTVLAGAVVIGMTLAAWTGLSFGTSGEDGRAAGPAVPGAEVGNCESLTGRAIERIPDAPTRIYSGQPQAATEVTIEASVAGSTDRIGKHAKLPAHCLVRGYIGPQVSFEIRLPSREAWNGKYEQVACGGFCGRVNSASCFPGLERGYAVATHDGGHDTEVPGFDGFWAWNNRPGEIDFGHRANHVVAQSAKAIIEAYYGRAAEYSYVVGCSKGGNGAVMEAMRYPKDFDGAIASAPVLDYQGRVATSFSWLMQALLDRDGRPRLSPDDFRVVHEAVLDECDALDGLEDRVLNDPSACRFDPATLRCRRPDDAGCLTGTQIRVLRRLYEHPINSDGEEVYPAGVTLGSELGEGGYLYTEEPFSARALGGANNWLAYLAFNEDPGPKFTYEDFDFDEHVDDLEALSPVYDANDTDLSEFRDRGGKLIITHGTADPAIPHEATIDYYEGLLDDMGGASRDFARLFLVPGSYHCFGGPGVDRIDSLTALEQWVEERKPPRRLSASHEGEGGIEREMPLFPYPKVPVYSGAGDPADPSSYVPTTSAAWRD